MVRAGTDIPGTSSTRLCHCRSTFAKIAPFSLVREWIGPFCSEDQEFELEYPPASWETGGELDT